MAGGNSITMKTSRALRAAGFPVLRWSATAWRERGIYCSSVRTTECDVSFNYTVEKRAKELRDEALEFLTGKGFACRPYDVTLRDGKTVYSISVYAPGAVPAWVQQELDEKTAQAAADLNAPTQAEA